MLNTHKSINIAIDLHRDGRDLKTDADIQKSMKECLQLIRVKKWLNSFCCRYEKSNVNEVKSLAEDITKFAKTKYPELVLSVVENQLGNSINIWLKIIC